MCKIADVSVVKGEWCSKHSTQALFVACVSSGNVLEGRVGKSVNCLSAQGEDALSAEQRNCLFTLESLKECVACTLSNERLDR